MNPETDNHKPWTCRLCGKPIARNVHGAGGRPQIYCCQAHRQQAYRNRIRAARDPNPHGQGFLDLEQAPSDRGTTNA